MTTVDLALSTAIDAENPVLGDLRVVNRALVRLTGADAVAQEIRVRLRWWKGEWFLDRRRGVPYIDGILADGATPGTIRAIVIAELAKVPDLAPHPTVTVRIDRRTRFCTIDIEGKTRSAGAAVVVTGVPLGTVN
jgi:hypothetical protein